MSGRNQPEDDPETDDGGSSDGSRDGHPQDEGSAGEEPNQGGQSPGGHDEDQSDQERPPGEQRDGQAQSTDPPADRTPPGDGTPEDRPSAAPPPDTDQSRQNPPGSQSPDASRPGGQTPREFSDSQPGDNPPGGNSPGGNPPGGDPQHGQPPGGNPGGGPQQEPPRGPPQNEPPGPPREGSTDPPPREPGARQGGPPQGAPQAGTGFEIDDTRWGIGWNPVLVILVPLVVGAVAGYLADEAAVFAGVGLIVGVGVWLWGVSEVNEKYPTLIENFRDHSRANVERSTTGLSTDSIHTFISESGGSPAFVEPSSGYSATNLLFGDTSLVINREYDYDMKGRNVYRGGEQRELFYDQISNVKSKNYTNFAELQINLSSGDREVIRSLDPTGLDDVKSDLQRRMRDSRR